MDAQARALRSQGGQAVRKFHCAPDAPCGLEYNRCRHCQRAYRPKPGNLGYCSVRCARLARVAPLQQLLGECVQPGPADACWTWTGKLDSEGYPIIHTGGQTLRVWRLLYEQAHGRIRGLVRSTCNTRACANPNHLFCEPDRAKPHPAATVPRNCENCGTPFLARTDHIAKGGGRWCRNCPHGRAVA